MEEIDRTYAARAAFLGKMRGYTARFAGFLHALDYVNRLRGPNGSGALFQIDKKISADTMRRALLLSQFFINQFDVLAPQVGGNEELPSWVVKIIELADSRPDKKVTVGVIRRGRDDDMQERKGMLEAMATGVRHRPDAECSPGQSGLVDAGVKAGKARKARPPF